MKPNQKVQVIVGDGLSSAAIERQILEMFCLPYDKDLRCLDLTLERLFFIKHCRVPAMDQIGEATGADVVCLLIGERPGLVTSESMSAYIAYKTNHWYARRLEGQ